MLGKYLLLCLNKQIELPEALKANQKALEIDPNDPEIYLCLGNNFNHQEKLNDAELSYKKAIELKPNYLQAFYNLALILKKMQRFDESPSPSLRRLLI